MDLRKQGKRLFSCLLVAVFLSAFVTVSPAFAEVSMDQLLERIEKIEQANTKLEQSNTKLEQENASLKVAVAALQDKQSTQDIKLAAVQTVPASSAVAGAPASGNFLKTKPEVELYGMLKTDLVYSDSNAGTTSNSQVAVSQAPRETVGVNQASFNGSAQDTRLGLNFKGLELDNGGKVTGKLEMDFASGQPSTTYTPRLRLAYSQIDFDKWAVTGGQAWDFFAPLNPNILNPGALYREGNLGFRHPQVYLTNKLGQIPGGKLTTKVGIIDSDDLNQENSGAPVAGVLVAYDTKVLGKALVLNVGGIYGTNSTGILGLKSTNNNNIYATTVGMNLTLADWLAFRAEGFTGAKLNSFTGGSTIGTTAAATATSSKSLRSVGGFAEVTYKPVKALETNYGIGVDYGNADQNVTANLTTIWKSNKTYYTNAKYSLSKDVLVGIEYQYLATNYMDGAKGDDNRIQSSLIYKF